MKTISASRRLLVRRSGSACAFALPDFVPREIALINELSFQVDPGGIDRLETNEKVSPQSLIAKAQLGKKP